MSLCMCGGWGMSTELTPVRQYKVKSMVKWSHKLDVVKSSILWSNRILPRLARGVSKEGCEILLPEYINFIDRDPEFGDKNLGTGLGRRKLRVW